MASELSLNQQLAQAISSFATINSFALWPRAHGLCAWQYMDLGPTIRPLYSVKTDISVCNRLDAPIQLKYNSVQLPIYDMAETDLLTLELEKIALA